MAYHCAIAGCSNGGYRLMKWKQSVCRIHLVQHSSPDCVCEPPFSLWPIPPRKTKSVQQDKWKILINRIQPTNRKLLSPSKDQRVCSVHFKNGHPTAAHPYPTEDLGYSDAHKKVARVLMREEVLVSSSRHASGRHRSTLTSTGSPEQVREHGQTEDDIQFDTDTMAFVETPLSVNGLLLALFTLFAVVLTFARQIHLLFEDAVKYSDIIAQQKKEIDRLRKVLDAEDVACVSPEQKCSSKGVNRSSKKQKACPDVFHELLTDKNVNYYTGLETKKLLQAIHDYVCVFVTRRWQGQSKCKERRRNFSKTPSRFGPRRFLTSIDEIALVLMRLRLGLDLRDLADRFHISSSLASKIFTAWIKALAAVLSHMIRIPDLETVIATKPSRYRSINLTNLMAIIDCTEFFIETPQDLATQAATWSDYKHHNTLKVLIAVCPNSYICYVSPVYEGRISDTELTKDCGFLEQLPPFTSVMADKGFNLALECTRLSLTLEIPPGRRGQSQMPMAAVQKTKKIANLRILVEQVISRLKCFKLLKNELSLTSADNTDDVVVVCAALCNLKAPIYTV